MARKRVKGRYVRETETLAGEGKKVQVAAPRPKSCRTYTRRRVAEALPEIVEKFLQEAKAGSVPHAKALASLGGLDRGDVVQKSVPRRKSFAGQLLEEFGRTGRSAVESDGDVAAAPSLEPSAER